MEVLPSFTLGTSDACPAHTHRSVSTCKNVNLLYNCTTRHVARFERPSLRASRRGAADTAAGAAEVLNGPFGRGASQDSLVDAGTGAVPVALSPVARHATVAPAAGPAAPRLPRAIPSLQSLEALPTSLATSQSALARTIRIVHPSTAVERAAQAWWSQARRDVGRAYAQASRERVRASRERLDQKDAAAATAAAASSASVAVSALISGSAAARNVRARRPDADYTRSTYHRKYYQDEADPRGAPETGAGETSAGVIAGTTAATTATADAPLPHTDAQADADAERVITPALPLHEPFTAPITALTTATGAPRLPGGAATRRPGGPRAVSVNAGAALLARHAGAHLRSASAPRRTRLLDAAASPALSSRPATRDGWDGLPWTQRLSAAAAAPSPGFSTAPTIVARTPGWSTRSLRTGTAGGLAEGDASDATSGGEIVDEPSGPTYQFSVRQRHAASSTTGLPSSVPASDSDSDVDDWAHTHLLGREIVLAGSRDTLADPNDAPLVRLPRSRGPTHRSAVSSRSVSQRYQPRDYADA